jgi:hypothetical protein
MIMGLPRCRKTSAADLHYTFKFPSSPHLAAVWKNGRGRKNHCGTNRLAKI